MDIPEIWTKLGSHMHQDTFVIYLDIEEAVSDFAIGIGEQDRQKLIDYLQFLESHTIPGVSKKAWAESGAQVSPVIRGGKSWAEFYRAIRLSVEVVSSGR